jgi:hypothetical protein
MSNIKSLMFLVMMFWAAIIHAQDDGKINMLEANFIGTQPLGTFGKNVNLDLFGGFEFRYLRQFRSQSPFFFGFHYHWAPYASATATITELLDNALVDFDYKTYANTQGIHSIVRFYAPFSVWKVEPYIEGIFGGKWMYSATSKTLVDEDTSDLSTEKSSFTIGYGAAIGSSIVISDDFYLNLRVSYLTGLQSKYLTRNSEDIVSTTAEAFDTKLGLSNMFVYSIGVTGVFD